MKVDMFLVENFWTGWQQGICFSKEFFSEIIILEENFCPKDHFFLAAPVFQNSNQKILENKMYWQVIMLE